MEYSTTRISDQLMDEIKNALQSVNYGIIEIFVTDNHVTQITTRTIKKTSITLKSNTKSTSNGNSRKSSVYSHSMVNVRAVSEQK